MMALGDDDRWSIDYLEKKWALGNVTRARMEQRVDLFETCCTVECLMQRAVPSKRGRLQILPIQMFDTGFVSSPSRCCLM